MYVYTCICKSMYIRDPGSFRGEIIINAMTILLMDPEWRFEPYLVVDSKIRNFDDYFRLIAMC